MTDSEQTGLAVIWSSADREVALNLVYMYTANSLRHEWWDRVKLIIWGPSAELICQDEELQDQLAEVKAAGVELLACKACANNYGVADRLTELGVKVIYMGQPLTELLKSGWQVLTF